MLAILTTHPIQYQVPLWQALAKDGRVPFEVWYLTSHATTPTRDREFGKEFAWDLDMLAGYPHKFLDVAPDATPNSFWKCRLKEKLRDRLRASGVKALWINGWQVAAYWQAVREGNAANAEVWLRGESNILKQRAGSREQGVIAYAKAQARESTKRILLKQLFNRVDQFLCIGTANRNLYRSYGVPESKLHVAPYAVDNERFRRQAEALSGKREAIRAEWGIPAESLCILFCGKFIPKKRPMDLIAAAALLQSKRSAEGQGQSGTLDASRFPLRPLHLLFVGSGGLGGELRAACSVVFDAEQSAKRGAPSTTLTASPFPLSGSAAKPPASFAGFLNQRQVSSAYVAADVLVLPSDYDETWGLVVNEAMASGLPCIVSDRCGCAEDLVPTESRFPAGEVNVLAETIRRFMATPGDSHHSLPLPTFATTVETVVRLYNKIAELNGVTPE